MPTNAQEGQAVVYTSLFPVCYSSGRAEAMLLPSLTLSIY